MKNLLYSLFILFILSSCVYYKTVNECTVFDDIYTEEISPELNSEISRLSDTYPIFNKMLYDINEYHFTYKCICDNDKEYCE